MRTGVSRVTGPQSATGWIRFKGVNKILCNTTYGVPSSTFRHQWKPLQTVTWHFKSSVAIRGFWLYISSVVTRRCAMRTVTRPDHNVEIIMRVNLIAYLWLCWYTYHHYILIINIALWHSLHNISAVLYCAHDGRWYSATPCRPTFMICFFLRRVKRLEIEIIWMRFK